MNWMSPAAAESHPIHLEVYVHKADTASIGGNGDFNLQMCSSVIV